MPRSTAQALSRQPASPIHGFARPVPPLPHPSWHLAGSASPTAERPRSAEDFFRRLGL